ncbi:hypothetical protein HAZT_HAZT009856, partial [Hyalella azteca]
MQGTEYMLLHAQDPILYIIRKQQRYSPSQATPLAAYHIIGGEVFQTPDIGSIINSRLASTMTHVNNSFTELASYSQYHPSKGYWWHFHNKPASSQAEHPSSNKENKDKKVSSKEEAATAFQRRRVDLLLQDITSRFPYRPAQDDFVAAAAGQGAASSNAVTSGTTNVTTAAITTTTATTTPAQASPLVKTGALTGAVIR